MAVTSSSWNTATPKKLALALNPGATKMLSSVNTMRTERKIYMQEQNKEVITITDEGIVIMDYLVADYEILVNRIVNKSCILLFDSKEAFETLNLLLEPFLKDRMTIELAEYIKKFIAEEWSQQVSIIDYLSHD